MEMKLWRLEQRRRAEERVKNKFIVVKPKKLTAKEKLKLEFDCLNKRKWEELTTNEIKRWGHLHKKLKCSA